MQIDQNSYELLGRNLKLAITIIENNSYIPKHFGEVIECLSVFRKILTELEEANAEENQSDVSEKAGKEKARSTSSGEK